MNGFEQLKPEELQGNVFSMFGKDWALVTAGIEGHYNTMTVSWGGMGVLWSRNVAFVFIRPQRYTYQFAENNDKLTISFFDEAYRPALNYCGSKSGRDVDKAKETGLTPVYGDGFTAFAEAKLVLVVKKLAAFPFDPHTFLDPAINKIYGPDDLHKMYISEVVGAYRKI